MQQRRVILLVITLLAMIAFTVPAYTQPIRPDSGTPLERDTSDPVEIIRNPQTGAASFIRASVQAAVLRLASAADSVVVAQGFVGRYAALLGVDSVHEQLQAAAAKDDELGMHHIKLAQVYQGVPVYSGSINVHLGPKQQLVALSSGFVPKISLATTRPVYDATYALAAAHKILPGGRALAAPKLFVYPFYEGAAGRIDRLTWLVELADDSTLARNRYLVDALAGTLLDVIDLQQDNRDRKTYDAQGSTSLPGTLRRSEADAATGDADVDSAHDLAGATYDYYLNTHGRDSYDGAGATLISTAHYGQGFKNAFWNGEQMVYGDGMVTRDVVAHELTHAVTNSTANLEYRWQSGALNESISDMFGAMVDRDDWLIGEELPSDVLGGQKAIRDMADPESLDQPANTADWVQTCSDEEGVHTNSGITNKGYYLIAEAIGKDKAERIFYRTLTVYLDQTSSLEDLRSAALQSATDLYGASSVEYNGVNTNLAAVGLNGTFDPPANSCVCSVTTVLSDQTLYPNPLAMLNTAATLYRVRSQLLDTTATGRHYRATYEEHTGRVSMLLLRDGALRADAAHILTQVTPGLDRLLAGEGDKAVVTADVIGQVKDFLRRLVERDRAEGASGLAQMIERETARLDFDRMVGMTYTEAWDAINNAKLLHPVYLPVMSH